MHSGGLRLTWGCSGTGWGQGGQGRPEPNPRRRQAGQCPAQEPASGMGQVWWPNPVCPVQSIQ